MIHPIQSGFMGYLHSQRITDANVVRTGSELCTMFATVLASEAASSRLLDLLGRVKQRRAAFNCAHAGGAYHARDPTHCLQHAPMLLAGTRGNFYHYGHILQLAKLAVREWFDIYHKDLSKEQWKRLMDRDFKGNPAKQWSTAITYAAIRRLLHETPHPPTQPKLSAAFTARVLAARRASTTATACPASTSRSPAFGPGAGAPTPSTSRSSRCRSS